ncbi:MAG: hypothetical protein COA43_05830 [Robiginitomaculum sp.]|nr:MAG: hypothetical protein COA43_05830 [Robiginitomaculum sp.]
MSKLATRSYLIARIIMYVPIGPLITCVGLENLIIIATKDSILILPKDRGQDVKNIVEALKKDGRAHKL